eukprot:gene11336-11424_t
MEGQKAKQVFSIFDTDLDIIFAHEEIDEKTNEIPVFQKLVAELAFIFKEFFTTDHGWNHAKELVIIHRIRHVFSTKTKKWNQSQKTSFYISTTSLKACEYMHAILVHWATENKNHYVKDVTLVEDASRIRINPGDFAKLRSWALGILRINLIKNVSYGYFEQPWLQGHFNQTFDNPFILLALVGGLELQTY